MSDSPVKYTLSVAMEHLRFPLVNCQYRVAKSLHAGLQRLDYSLGCARLDVAPSNRPSDPRSNARPPPIRLLAARSDETLAGMQGGAGGAASTLQRAFNLLNLILKVSHGAVPTMPKYQINYAAMEERHRPRHCAARLESPLPPLPNLLNHLELTFHLMLVCTFP
jgi:hypothetical protein